MQKLKIYIILSLGLVFLSTCKKEKIIVKNTDQFAIKYDPGNGIYIVSAVQSEDNNYYLFGNLTNMTNKSQDGFVMKVDENLNIVWNKTFGGNKYDEFSSLAIDNLGNLMVVGNSSSFGTSVDSNYKFPNPRFYMVYIDKDGNTLWEKTMQANEGPGKLNRFNAASKVLFIKKNNTFAITGSTRNFKNKTGNDSNYTKDIFAFGMDNTGKIKWQKRFYDTAINPKNQYEENCYQAETTDDGNIILLMTHYYYPYTNLTFIKIATNDTGYSENKYIWKGPEISDITTPFQGYETGTPSFDILNNDKILIVNYMSGRICLTDDRGKIVEYDYFGKPVNCPAIGLKNFVSNALPEWSVFDLDGNEIHKVNVMDPIGDFVFFNVKKEFYAFGAGQVGGIAMRKYDYNGNILIK
ncbi:MAG: hypothetical protein ACKVQB_01765 [Bacteroidia bacterium]